MMSIPPPSSPPHSKPDDQQDESDASSSSQSQDNSTHDGSDNDSKFHAGVGVECPGEHDLLLGRGGETNSHSGNHKFRKLIEEYRPIYAKASRRDKPDIAKQLVAHWRGLDPPGRFLQKKTSAIGEATKKLWYEIGDEAAKKRASKSLGERQKAACADPKDSPFTGDMGKHCGKRKSTKSKLRSLEARAARSDLAPHMHASPRNDRIEFPGGNFVLYQSVSMPMMEQLQQSQQSHSNAASIIAGSQQNFPIGLPQLLQGNSGAVNTNKSFHASMHMFAAASSDPQGAMNIPAHTLAAHSMPTLPVFQAANTTIGNTNHGNASNLVQMGDDVPTAAELTTCWDDE